MHKGFGMSTKTAIAGTMESNDIMITVSASRQEGKNTIVVESIVMRRFGPAIVAAIEDCLTQFNVNSVHIDAKDRGALECTIKARMETALLRYKELGA
jgi:citrate lyase subunit gamma (acyl carrier protein)